MWQSAQATPVRAWMPWLHSLKLRMLRLEQLGAGLGVLPVVEAVAVREPGVVVGRFDLLDLQAVAPRGRTASASGRSSTRRGIGRRRTSASPAARRRRSDRRARSRSPLRQRSMLGQVRHGRVARGERRDAVDEARPRHAQGHRLGIVAIDAGDRMRAGGRARSSCVVAARHRIRRAGLHHLGVRVADTKAAERHEARAGRRRRRGRR